MSGQTEMGAMTLSTSRPAFPSARLAERMRATHTPRMTDLRPGAPMARPLVSAIVPTYNRAHCLPRALDSIYAQEGLGDQFDIEAIVVDDGSSDATSEVVREYPDLRFI